MDAKAAAREAIESRHAALVDLSHRIHAHPELAFEEEKASAWCAEALAAAGFEVEKPFCGLPTAFRARAGSGPLHVAICAEYDARRCHRRTERHGRDDVVAAGVPDAG
ncbi:MAG: hypothetical protein ACKORK_00420, partial [Gemmatimonadota bacterium]